MKTQLNHWIILILLVFAQYSLRANTPTSYTLIDDDYGMVGSGKYDNFTIYSELDEIWTRHKIAYILEKRFEDATDGTSIHVKYDYYDGSRKSTEETFTQEKNTWLSEEGSHEIPSLETKTEGLQVVTWNLEWFGAADGQSKSIDSNEWQLKAATAQILRMNADVYALQEVVVDGYKGNNLQKLVNALNAESLQEWDGFYSLRHSLHWQGDNEDYPAQKIAFIYKKERVTLKKQFSLFEEDYISGSEYDLPGYSAGGSYFMSSGRLPLVMEASVQVNGESKDFVFVNVHFKCCNDGTSRRQADAEYLYKRLQEDYPTDNVIILGDYNNATYNGEDGPKRWGWYDEQAYVYAGGQDDGIDHLSISNELIDELISSENAYYTEREVGSFSDHDPHLLSLSYASSDAQIAYFNASESKGKESEQTQITYRITLQEDATENMTFSFELEGAATGEYELSKTNFQIEKGERTDHIILTVLKDTEKEGKETWKAKTANEAVLFFTDETLELVVEDLLNVNITLSSYTLDQWDEDEITVNLSADQFVPEQVDFQIEIPAIEGLELSTKEVSIPKYDKRASFTLSLGNAYDQETDQEIKLVLHPLTQIQNPMNDVSFTLTLKAFDRDAITSSDQKEEHDFAFMIKNQQLFIRSLTATRQLLQLAIFHIDAQKVFEKTIDILPKQEVILTEKNLKEQQIYIIRYEQGGKVKSLKIKA